MSRSVDLNKISQKLKASLMVAKREISKTEVIIARYIEVSLLFGNSRSRASSDACS